MFKFIMETHNSANSSVNENSLNICRLIAVSYLSLLSSFKIPNVRAAVSVSCGCER